MSELSPEVVALIRERIESYEALHGLLLLYAERRGHSAEELSARLQLSNSLVAAALDSLERHQLVARAEPPASQPRYHYASGAHDAALAALKQAYTEQPIVVIRILAAGSIERIRSEALRAFADAFVFRNNK